MQRRGAAPAAAFMRGGFGSGQRECSKAAQAAHWPQRAAHSRFVGNEAATVPVKDSEPRDVVVAWHAQLHDVGILRHGAEHWT